MTFNGETSAVAAIVGLSIGGLTFRVRLHGEGLKERYPSGDVIDTGGNVIGSAYSYTYGGRAFAVHTGPFAGYVEFSECEFV
jgi:hypothetical protein